MHLFCELYGHWPVPFASWRRDGSKLNRCWLCGDRIVQRKGLWQVDRHETARADRGETPRRFETQPLVAGEVR